MTVSCIDISHWQGFPDFEAVAASGVVACIMKATEGTSYIDPNRATNFVNATRAGIACCTYHWIKPANAKAQMEFYLGVVDPVVGERMVIDYEEEGCDLDDLHEAVETLLEDPRQLKITVYSGHLLKEQLNGSSDDFLAENTDLWLAQYTDSAPTWPNGTYTYWSLWQYSETGQIDGIDGTAVDLNRFDGSDVELVQWISPDSSPPKPPKPPPASATVNVAITAPSDVIVNVTLNGGVAGIRRPRHRLVIPRQPDTGRQP